MKSRDQVHGFGAKLLSYGVWIGFLAIALHYGRQVVAGGDGWRTGDWLINYEAGLVRRGLIGQIFYALSELGLPLKWVAYSVQTAIYGLIFFLVHRIYLARDKGHEWLVVLLCPAFLLFPLYDFQGGYRKEIIVYASFVVLAYAYSRRQLSPWWIVVSLMLYALAAFSHEMAAFTFPFFAVMLLNAYRQDQIDWRLAASSSGAFAVVAVGSLVFSIFFPGGLHVSQQICASLHGKGLAPDICDGAIRWIKADVNDAMTSVVAMLPTYFYVYIPLLALSTLPLFLSSWPRRNWPLMLFGFLGVLPLFVVATDWGRWLNIYIFFAFVSLLADAAWQEIRMRRLPVAVLFAYLVFWSVPHWGRSHMGFGLSEFVYKVFDKLVL